MSGLHLGEGSQYIDKDGQVKQFTTVDWSKKIQVGYALLNEGDANAAAEDSKQMLLAELISLPAVLARPEKENYTMIKDSQIVWNENVLLGLTMDDIFMILILVRNRRESKMYEI